MPSSSSIKTTATEARNLLDKAKINIATIRSRYESKKEYAETFKQQDFKIANTRGLLTKLKYNSDFHLDFLAEPLNEVKNAVKELGDVLADGKQKSLDAVTNAIDDVNEATGNLKSRLPVEMMVETTGLTADKNAVQLAGPMFKEYTLQGRGIFTATGHTAKEGSIQVASLVVGDSDFVHKLQDGQTKRMQGQKGDGKS